eukprot:jgi/Undpi1/3720/HiC_scaffold_16.g07090.m1
MFDTGDARSSETLFTPSPFLTRASVSAIEPHLRHAWLPLTCIDIGCGAGRDAVWLAKRGWTVTAVDCWKQALRKTVQLAKRMGVSDRVEVLRGKVKYTGEMLLAVKAERFEDSQTAASATAANGVGRGGGGQDVSFQAETSLVAEEEDRVISKSTTASEYGAYSLVIAIRFLERSAFDTLARLVDPRGGYLLLSTFIEEDRETVPREGERHENEARASDKGGKEGGGGAKEGNCEGGSLGVGSEERRRKGRGGSGVDSFGRTGAAALAVAARAATMARWPHDSPRDPKKILRRGELAQYFRDRHGFEVVEDGVDRLPDGRPGEWPVKREIKTGGGEREGREKGQEAGGREGEWGGGREGGGNKEGEGGSGGMGTGEGGEGEEGGGGGGPG